jgi:hypothetical protein
MEFIQLRYPEKEVEVFKWEDNVAIDNRLDLVYFTTSRDIEADREALNHILKLTGSVYVRLHPNDSSENYSMNGLHFLNDYSASIEAKAVISRPSTVLVEAERSGAKVCVMLLSEQDLRRFDLYPAFSDSYYKVESLSDINEFINENAK